MVPVYGTIRLIILLNRSLPPGLLESRFHSLRMSEPAFSPLNDLSIVKSFSGENAGSLIRREWKRLSSKPGGKLLFSKMISLMVPYTGTIGARVEEIREGYAKVQLTERRGIRNHLQSIHRSEEQTSELQSR